MTKIFRSVLPVLLLIQSTFAANWPHWRGPNFTGSTDEINLPDTWSKTENVVWKAALPGPSGSSPVIWGDHVFVSTPDAQKNLNLVCLNRKDGSALWQKQVGIGDRNAGPRSNMTSPSPVTDGKVVVVMYGTGDLAAFDFNGKELWKRNLGVEGGKFAIMWLYGSSPTIYEGKLYVQVLQTTPVPEGYTHARDGKETRDSFLLCINLQTGKDIWKHIRNSEARMESKESYATPIPFEGPNGKEILVLGGDCITGHDAKTGAEIWRAGGLNPKNDPYWRIVPSPVAGGGVILASAPKRDPVYAFKVGGNGDITESHLAWKLTENPTDWSTPLFYKNRFYVLDGDRHVLTCVKPESGEKIWQTKIEIRDPIWSSPLGADGRIYLISEGGTAFVIDAEEGKVSATIPMSEGPARSSIVASQGQLFVRTAENLYCIGKK
ncbi:MAG TPA: PQQ-binding-like beta-propeller repeat protein [Verrucomicrobiae bacterium]|nr:PQQ-binding-like beta-propeller repeat protein [Verrucomicrobiae bacterium]